ncbi:thioredoxin peroxidase dot5 [Umbelopsis sp. WA50703]
MPPKRKAASAASEAISNIQAPTTRATRSKSDAAVKKAKVEPTVTLLQEGDQLPDDLSPVTTDAGVQVRIQDLAKESGLLIFFYPRANTPGCTTQACGFRDKLADVTAEGWKIYGMSLDSPKAQTTWKQKYSLGYDLLCDPQGEVLKRLGVTKTQSGNGGGVKRSHVVIEKGGRIKSLKIGVSPAQSIAQGIEAMTGKSVAHEPAVQNGTGTHQVSEPSNTEPFHEALPAVAATVPEISTQAELTDAPVVGNDLLTTTTMASDTPAAAAAVAAETGATIATSESAPIAPVVTSEKGDTTIAENSQPGPSITETSVTTSAATPEVNPTATAQSTTLDQILASPPAPVSAATESTIPSAVESSTVESIAPVTTEFTEAAPPPAPIEPSIPEDLQAQIAQLPTALVGGSDLVAPGLAPVIADFPPTSTLGNDVVANNDPFGNNSPFGNNGPVTSNNPSANATTTFSEHNIN